MLLTQLVFLAATGIYNILVVATILNTAPSEFRIPISCAVDYVNPMIGTGGDSPNGSGGMIPSTGPPFAMTRWVAQTRQNYVSVTPYNQTDTTIHGFQGTHQPAIWMGESGQVIVAPGMGLAVNTAFEQRGLLFDKETEISTPSYYKVKLSTQEGFRIIAEQTSTSRVGHLRFTFNGNVSKSSPSFPYVVVQATRAYVLGSENPSNTTSPMGSIRIDSRKLEISGRNPERQDHIIGPHAASNFAGYFVARFDTPFTSFGTARNETLFPNEKEREDQILSAYVAFPENTHAVSVRIGVSFISIAQARANLEAEIPDEQSMEKTATITRSLWAEKLDRIQIEGASAENLTTFYTAFFHSLQYPYEQSEYGQYYSGYDETVHTGESYTGYSIWDVYRAEWAWLILLAPERVGPMITSMLQDFEQGGWLPMWKNIVETNIMIGTHADSLIAEAMLKGIDSFDVLLAFKGVYKDATVPPANDSTIRYADREENVGYEVRAGLSTVYEQVGWVADDVHSEAGSRTLAYAYDDYATSVVSEFLNDTESKAYFFKRSHDYHKIFNQQTGFMESRNMNGSLAGPDNGWTEGDKWAYTFDVVHDIPGLISLKKGNQSFLHFLDEHFAGGHNDHANEPSHHIPYLYALAGAASKTQVTVRAIAEENYNSTVNGLSGVSVVYGVARLMLKSSKNEDCGQMSAWYLFSALGFYPVNPSSTKYVIGSPFFDKITIRWPGKATTLLIDAPRASREPYVKSLAIDRHYIHEPIVDHFQLTTAGVFSFEMSSNPQKWASPEVETTEAVSSLLSGRSAGEF